jgi:hypothetical protein
MKKFLILSMVCAMAFYSVPAMAEQHDYDVANGPGATVRADINNAFEAVATNNSGGTAPAAIYANMWWFDTATNILKQRDEANTAWINVAYKNGSDWTPYSLGSLLTTVATSSFSSQAQAEAGTDNATTMTPLRVAQRQTAVISSQAQAEAGTDNATFMTPLRVKQGITALQRSLASQAEAEAGTDNTKDMTSLRVAQAIAALTPDSVTKEVFTSNGTFTAPDGITEVFVSACGAGGGGGGGSGPTPGGGGGGGAYVLRQRVKVTPSSGYTATIGAAGAAGASNGDGGLGGTTTFAGDNKTVSCNGGAGGLRGETGGGGSAGGTSSGSLAGAGGLIPTSVGGAGVTQGAGGSTWCGVGGAHNASPTDGHGGGGGGGLAAGDVGNAGAAGYVLVEW